MCKELIRGQAFDFWEEAGGDGRGDLRKKYPEVWFWAQKSLTRKYLPYNSFVCQGKTFYDYQRFSGKTILTQTHEVTQITCRKSCYCLILRWRHQSSIVHSRSKLIHVYLLLYDDITACEYGDLVLGECGTGAHGQCKTAGRLGKC